MRYLSWLAALVVVVALAAGATSIVLAHSTPKHTLIASRSLITVGANDVVNLSDPAPQHMIPRPSPDPSPTPPPPPPAAPAAPVHSAPPPPRPASPAIVIGSTQQALINHDRERNSLAPLPWNSCLPNLARNSAAMSGDRSYSPPSNGPSAVLTLVHVHPARGTDSS